MLFPELYFIPHHALSDLLNCIIIYFRHYLYVHLMERVCDMCRTCLQRLMGIKMATFKLHLICRWSSDDFEIYKEGFEGSDIESS